MDLSVVLLLLIHLLTDIQGKVSVNLTVSSPSLIDAVLSEDTVKICLNTTEVEFRCMAENVFELTWSRVRMNEMEEIFTFHIRSQPPFSTPDGYTVYLDNSTTINHQLQFAPITSRLRVATISDIIGGMIECRVFANAEESFINESLRVSLQDPPPRPHGINISVTGWQPDTLVDVVNITLQWNEILSSVYAITKYRVSVITFLTGVMCPPVCHPNESCVCGGLLTSDGVNLTVSAVNCDNQEGPTTDITIKKCQIQNLAMVTDKFQTSSICNTAFSALIPSGYICYDGLTFGSVAIFQCDEGYQLMGSSQLQCQLDGEWDSDTPTCECFECGLPPHHTNATSIGIAAGIPALLFFTLVIIIFIVLVLFAIKRKISTNVMGESGVAVSTNTVHDGSGDVGAIANEKREYDNVPALWEKGNDVMVSENIAYGQVKLGHEDYETVI